MEQNLKGTLVTLTLIALFATSILSFIVVFPQEQGVNYNDLRSNETYLIIESNTDFGIQTELDSIEDTSTSGFDNWDITEGFMGSNTVKQGSLSGAESYRANVFSTLTLIATKLFNPNSPIVYAIGVIATLAAVVLIYLTIKFIRQGE